jgi:eukaryotic-like serine/threonine-protein kinase
VLRTVEKYEILSEIGHGGMASVYRARDTRLDRLVALKVLHPHLRGSEEARVRFTREAKSVAKLRHPNVLEIYDYSGEGSEESYIAAELLTGPTLKDYVANERDIPAEIVACFGVQIARALGAAHAKGIVHRDVKPENVLLHERRIVKLTDFGIAHMVEMQGYTATGQILGSPGHMAPEQVESGDCDERTDVFALGTVLYFLATGRLPFSGKNPQQILRRVVECEYPDPLRIRASIGGALRGIIVRAMAKAPADRHAGVAELEAALLAFLEASGVRDPDLCLVEYLADPEAKAVALIAEIVPRLVVLGTSAAERGDVPAALDSWNRVLALDEGNEEVMRRIKALGRAQGKRRALGIAARSTLAVCVAGLALHFAMGMREGERSAPPAPDDLPDRASEGAMTSETDLETTSTSTSTSTSASLPVAGQAPDAGDPRPSRVRRVSQAEREPQRRPQAHGPRLVVFQPSPQNVLIGVDGAPPRPFGPSFRSVELEPGRHRFRFVAGTVCCQDSELLVDVAAGDSPLVIRRVLPFNAARLYVVSSVPADVRVELEDAPAVTGRARELLPVPMNRLEQSARILVTAPGHRPHSGQVRLRAGEVVRAQVALQPEAASP